MRYLLNNNEFIRKNDDERSLNQIYEPFNPCLRGLRADLYKQHSVFWKHHSSKCWSDSMSPNFSNLIVTSVSFMRNRVSIMTIALNMCQKLWLDWLKLSEKIHAKVLNKISVCLSSLSLGNDGTEVDPVQTDYSECYISILSDP